MRIAVAGFHHETNTFSPKKATYEDFVVADDWPGLCKGEELLKTMSHGNIPMVGFLEKAKQKQWKIEPLVWCNAQPSGVIQKEAYERIVRDIIFGLQPLKNELDAIYLDLHGAMVAENTEDGEGELLYRIRRVMGDDIPIVISLDFHANVTRDMFKYADAIVGYHTYPHIDMYDTGKRAATILAGILHSGEKPKKAMRKLPFLVPITAQCTMIDPAKSLFDLVKKRLEQSSLMEVSLLMGFPAADIAECGPAIVTYATQQEDAYRICDEIEEAMLNAESKFISKLWSPEDAVFHAMRIQGDGPVILADTQDNPGAGGSSNSAGILHALIQQNAKNAVVACHYDPENAALAKRCGEKKELFLSLGGHVADDVAVEDVFKVERISDKPFYAEGPYYEGCYVDLGTMALVSHKGVKVLLVSKRVQPTDRAFLTHMGIDPAEQSILVLKSSVHFRADFQDIAKDIMIVESPGLNIENPEKLPYKFLRKGVRMSPHGKVMH